MKIRTGFVSNSSSSSFVIETKYLTDLQIFMIKHHIKFAKVFSEINPELQFDCGDLDGWGITEKDGVLSGFTVMDNFSMRGFLQQIGVPIAFFDSDN